MCAFSQPLQKHLMTWYKIVNTSSVLVINTVFLGKNCLLMSSSMHTTHKRFPLAYTLHSTTLSSVSQVSYMASTARCRLSNKNFQYRARRSAFLVPESDFGDLVRSWRLLESDSDTDRDLARKFFCGVWSFNGFLYDDSKTEINIEIESKLLWSLISQRCLKGCIWYKKSKLKPRHSVWRAPDRICYSALKNDNKLSK